MSNTITIYLPDNRIPTKEDLDLRLKSLQVVPQEVEIDAKRISDQITKLVQVIGSIDDIKGNYELNSIELDLVVTASGKLAILGSALQGGVTTGFKLKILKRQTNGKGDSSI